jgi:ubiquinone biosynthesis protein
MKKRGMETMSAAEKTSETAAGAHSHRIREILAVLYRHEVIKGVTPEKLRLILQDLGPTFVKIGQILSMRTDLLPEAFLRELSLLRDSVRPMAFAEVREILEEEFGAKPGAIFSSFEEEPIGAASIAQVHKAALATGEKVVVKVQRAGIDERMQKDMVLLRRAAGLLKLSGVAGSAVDFRTVLDEMWFVAQQEMDFLTEAQNVDLFAAFQRDVAYVGCPKVYSAYTTRRVLVMEYVDGIPINQREKLLKQGYDLSEIAAKLCASYVKQMLEDGFFHADPHPGNLCIREGKIVFLDLGMVGRLTAREQQLLKRAVGGIALNDVQETKEALLSLAVHTQPIDHARLYEDIEMVINRYSRMEMGQMNLGRMMEEVLAIANRHSLQLPEGMAMLSRGLVTMQGVVSQLDPQVDFMSIMAANVKGNLFSEIDFSGELKQGVRTLYRSGKKALELPYQLSEFLRMAVKGQGKINLELTGSEKPLHTVSRMVNRLILCLLCCALLIASALICQTAVAPRWFGVPWPAFLGFFVSAGLLALLLQMIWRGRKMN